MTRERARRIIELLYMHVYLEGTVKAKSEVIRQIKFFKKEYNIGTFKYNSDRGFEWYG